MPTEDIPTDPDPGPGRTHPRRRSRRRTLGAVALVVVVAAVAGGVVGWLLTDGSGSGTGAAAANGTDVGACPATHVAEVVLPSVVTVRVTGSAESVGSGVVFRSGGYVLTNDHVIAPAARGGAISVRFSDGDTATARVVGRDPLTDLAVLKTADGQKNEPAIALGSSSSLEVGEPVVALGSPLGLTSTVTSGIVSALDRYVRVPSAGGQTAYLVGAIQTDASINPGNSGGPLVDCSGKLVGVNSAGATLSESAGGSIGLGFAIPIDLARDVADALVAHGTVERPTFGMQVQTITAEVAHALGGTPGLYVLAVTAGGPAARAGLRAGDVITKVDGKDVVGVDDLIVKTLTMRAGETLDLTYERAGASSSTALTLGSAT